MGISFSLINTCLDSINAFFGATILELQWMINLYGIFIAATLVAMGRFGDLFGRKKIYLLGSFFFILAMLGAGLATSPSMIIAFMPFYGLAGAIILPLSQAMMVHLYPEEEKGKAIGLWAAQGGIALAVGPLLGGVVCSYLPWRWVFLVNIPISLLSLLMTVLYCPDSRSEQDTSKIDWPGVILLFLTVGTFVLATVQSNLWPPSIIASLYLLTILFFVSLLLVESKAETPIICEALFTDRRFLLSSVVGFCLIGFFWGAIFLIPLAIQKVLLFPPMKSGLALLFLTLPIALFSPFSSFFYRKLGPKALFFIGFVSLALSTLLFLRFDQGSTFATVSLSILVMGVGFAFVWAPVITSALSTVSNNATGIAAGSFVTIQEIGGSASLAITGAAFRMTPNLLEGFHQGVWVLFFICLVAIIASLGMPRRQKNQDSQNLNL